MLINRESLVMYYVCNVFQKRRKAVLLHFYRMADTLLGRNDGENSQPVKQMIHLY